MCRECGWPNNHCHKSKKTYNVTTNQNGGEYKGHTYITCKSIEKVLDNDRSIKADGVLIEFDETILDIEEGSAPG